MIETYSICDIGLKRKTNEDSFYCDDSNDFIVVSDGMGGYEKGDIASNIIVKEFTKELSMYQSPSKDLHNKKTLSKHLENANQQSTKQILEYAKQNNINTTMGATVVGLCIDKIFNKIALFHLGDSRVYRIRNNQIEQLTDDHSLTDNVLSKAIGNFDGFELEINYIDYNDNDIFLVCSDGIYNFILDKELLDTIQNNKINYSCNIIKEIIYKNGAKDNLTLVLSKIVKDCI